MPTPSSRPSLKPRREPHAADTPLVVTGPGRARISTQAGFGREPIPGGALAWTNWIAGIVAVYASLFGPGKIVFGELGVGIALLAVAAAAFAAAAFAWIARSFQTSLDPLGRLARHIAGDPRGQTHEAPADAHEARLYG